MLIIDSSIFNSLGSAGCPARYYADLRQRDPESESAFFAREMDFVLDWVSELFKDCINMFNTLLIFSLMRYLHPTDDELKSLAGVPKEKGGKGKDKRNGHSNAEKSSTFHIPRSLDIHLDTVNITHYDVLHLRYFTEYQWLIDFSVYAAIVYFISEVYHFFVPLKDEVNLSMIWCLLVIFFAL